MPRPYTEKAYFYPPRTKAKAPWGDSVILPMWRRFEDAVAQFKLNGTRNMVYVHKPSMLVEFWNRHALRQKYVIPDVMREKILAMSPDGWTIWDTELLHFKTKFIKDTLYFYDCLVYQNEHQAGVSYRARHDIVRGSVQGVEGEETSIPLNLGITPEEQGAALGQNRLFVADNFAPEKWDWAWDQAMGHKFIEGLVLKRLASRLEYGHTEVNNSGWMCRIRKPEKNLLF